jgi:hypothetical protein
VQTGITERHDGYEAAMATVQAHNYQIAANDPKHGYLRVRAKPGQRDGQQSGVTYFEIHSMPGTVDIFVTAANGHPPTEPEARQLRPQLEALAWGIQSRAPTPLHCIVAPGYSLALVRFVPRVMPASFGKPERTQGRSVRVDGAFLGSGVARKTVVVCPIAVAEAVEQFSNSC